MKQELSIFILGMILLMGIASSYVYYYNPNTLKNDWVNYLNGRIKEMLTFDGNAGIVMNISSNITFNSSTVCPKISVNSSGCLIQQSCSGSKVVIC
jgi:hypothetical protein